MPSCAAIIIGDEILTGKFQDENGPYLIRRLRELGVSLKCLSIIPDSLEGIAEEISRCKDRFSWVLTTGGVGPTHDDMTFAGIARALKRPLVRHPEIVRIIEEKFAGRVNEAALRMSEVPEGAQLWWDGDLYFPQVVIENIVVFPGVPGLVKLKFEAVCWRFMGEPVATARLWTFAEEVEIATVLSEAQLRWPGVAIGSYPRYEESPHRVVVTLEGERKGEVEEVYGFLMERMVGASSA